MLSYQKGVTQNDETLIRNVALRMIVTIINVSQA